MRELGYLFPGKWLTPYSKWSLQIEALIKRVKNGFVVNMNDTFKKLNSVMLFLGIVVILLKFNPSQQSVLKGFESARWENQRTNQILLLILRVIFGVVHVLEHLECTRPHGYAHAIHNLFVGSYFTILITANKANESL
jgi:hypothetical protein